jgi:uncharacterized OB-fold protein
VTYFKPLPTPTVESEPYWDGLREHVLRIRLCLSCGDYDLPHYPACRSCMSEDREWVAASGDATVWSYSVVHRGPGAFRDEVPYVVVLAKLAEEPRANILLSNLVDCDPDHVTIGKPIRAVFEHLDEEGLTLLRFAPAEPG